ncbi:MAG: hypothetical protein FJ054_11020 [Cyanobacteria bacterium M_surface_10_m2_119]|nr:hypothetical protein [Cyanobacteria bacterium M_surface_10_m2_119]
MDDPVHEPAGGTGLDPEPSQQLTGDGLAALCGAVAAETGIPEGRVRKVLLSAQRLQRAGGWNAAATPAPDPGPASATPGSHADRLRFYPLGANGRLRPPAPLPAAATSPGEGV